MIKRRRPLNTRRERLEIPQVSKRPQDRRGTVCHLLALAVDTELLNVPLRDPRGDDPRWQTASKTVKLEGVLILVRRGDGVSEVVRARCQRRRHVVVETSGLVKGDDEEGVLPLRAVTEGIVHLLEENLAVRNQASGVHRVCANATAGRVDVGELWEAAEVGVLVELVEGLHVRLGGAAGDGPVKVHGVTVAGYRCIVLPGDVLRGQLLEDGVLG